jgi:LacI family transcriptional regulator
MPTIRDISEYTGLAFGTVSKYINGGNVRPENRAILEEAVSKLNYRVNCAARTLKRQRSSTIGVVLPAASLAGSGSMLTALDRTLAEQGYASIVCAYAEKAPEREKLRLLSGNVDGIVILPSAIEAWELRALCGNLPVVLLDCVYPDAVFDSVLTDYLGIAYQAAEQLFARQHEHIGAIFGAYNDYAISELRTGFLRAFADYQKTPITSLLVESECGYAMGHAQFMRFLEGPLQPTALFVSDPLLSMGAEAAANEKGLLHTKDFDLIGFGETGTHRIPGRRMSLFELSGEALGQTAATLLLSRLNGSADALPVVRRIKAELRMPDLQTAQ